MRPFDHLQSPNRRAATATAAMAATALVNALLVAAVSTSAYAVPTMWRPLQPDALVPALITTVEPEKERPCFMGRPHWSTEAAGPQPRCAVAERTASLPRSIR